MRIHINSISTRFHLEMDKKWHKDKWSSKILHLIKENIGLFYLLYQVQFSRTLRLCFSELFIKGSVTHPTYHTSLRDSSDGNESDNSMKRTTYLTSLPRLCMQRLSSPNELQEKPYRNNFLYSHYANRISLHIKWHIWNLTQFRPLVTKHSLSITAKANPADITTSTFTAP